jgi:flagellar protein FliO/FliZ
MDPISVAKMLAALVFTLALIGGAAFLARRFGMLDMAPRKPGAEKRMRVVESLMLDPRRRLVLVRVDAHDHLLLLSPGADVAIAKVDAPPTPSAEGAGT